MTFDRIVIISKDEPSAWKSCQTIVSNLASSYGKAFCNSSVQFLKVSQDLNSYQAFKMAMQIKKINPGLIVWIDHSPNPTFLIKYLSEVFNDISFEQRPKMLVHVFGDFVLDCLDWESIKKELALWPLHFITASDRQKKLLERFFISDKNIVSCIPFPVHEQQCKLENFSQNRKKTREKYSIEDDEKVFLYTGRISYQKNIEVLVKSFLAINKTLDRNCQLWIAGGVDDILLPYLGKHGNVCSYSSHLNQTLNIKNSNIKLLGNCSSEELLMLYHASDMFVSMSTYNDEDYGMSPAEAICNGLPSLLSDWGGYSSFANYSESVRLVPVSLDSFRPMVDTVILGKELMAEAMQPNCPLEMRKNFAEKALSFVSVESVAKKLETEMQSFSFSSVNHFSDVFTEMCRSFKNNKMAPFKNSTEHGKLSPLYKDVYSAYCD
jgi:glycosyltransferase involved in cell wall biosynthesis